MKDDEGFVGAEDDGDENSVTLDTSEDEDDYGEDLDGGLGVAAGDGSDSKGCQMWVWFLLPCWTTLEPLTRIT